MSTQRNVTNQPNPADFSKRVVVRNLQTNARLHMSTSAPTVTAINDHDPVSTILRGTVISANVAVSCTETIQVCAVLVPNPSLLITCAQVDITRHTRVTSNLHSGERPTHPHPRSPIQTPIRPTELPHPAIRATRLPTLVSLLFVCCLLRSRPKRNIDSYPPSEPSIATSDDAFIEIASHADSDPDRVYSLGSDSSIRDGFGMTNTNTNPKEKRRHGFTNDKRRACKYRSA